jgi:hypothetical protein
MAPQFTGRGTSAAGKIIAKATTTAIAITMIPTFALGKQSHLSSVRPSTSSCIVLQKKSVKTKKRKQKKKRKHTTQRSSALLLNPFFLTDSAPQRGSLQRYGKSMEAEKEKKKKKKKKKKKEKRKKERKGVLKR